MSKSMIGGGTGRTIMTTTAMIQAAKIKSLARLINFKAPSPPKALDRKLVNLFITLQILLQFSFFSLLRTKGRDIQENLSDSIICRFRDQAVSLTLFKQLMCQGNVAHNRDTVFFSFSNNS